MSDIKEVSNMVQRLADLKLQHSIEKALIAKRLKDLNSLGIKTEDQAKAALKKYTRQIKKLKAKQDNLLRKASRILEYYDEQR